MTAAFTLHRCSRQRSHLSSSLSTAAFALLMAQAQDDPRFWEQATDCSQFYTAVTPWTSLQRQKMVVGGGGGKLLTQEHGSQAPHMASTIACSASEAFGLKS